MDRLEIKQTIKSSAASFHDQMYGVHSELGNIAGEFMALNVDYVLLHQGVAETYRTRHILQTGFSNNQKKYLEHLSKRLLEDSDAE